MAPCPGVGESTTTSHTAGTGTSPPGTAPPGLNLPRARRQGEGEGWGTEEQTEEQPSKPTRPPQAAPLPVPLSQPPACQEAINCPASFGTPPALLGSLAPRQSHHLLLAAAPCPAANTLTNSPSPPSSTAQNRPRVRAQERRPGGTCRDTHPVCPQRAPGTQRSAPRGCATLTHTHSHTCSQPAPPAHRPPRSPAGPAGLGWPALPGGQLPGRLHKQAAKRTRSPRSHPQTTRAHPGARRRTRALAGRGAGFPLPFPSINSLPGSGSRSWPSGHPPHGSAPSATGGGRG